MAIYKKKIFIARPLAETFAFVTDFRHTALWDPRVSKAEMIGDGPIGYGTRFELTSPVFGYPLVLPYEITFFDPPHAATLAGSNELLVYTDELTFEDIGGGTRLTYAAELSLAGIFALGQPLMRFFVQKIGDDATREIREQAERAIPR